MKCEVGVGTLRIRQHTMQSPAEGFPPEISASLRVPVNYG